MVHAFGGETVKLSEVPEVVKSMEENGPDFVECCKVLERAISGEKMFGSQTRREITQILMFTLKPQAQKYGRAQTEILIFSWQMWEQAERFLVQGIILNQRIRRSRLWEFSRPKILSRVRNVPIRRKSQGYTLLKTWKKDTSLQISTEMFMMIGTRCIRIRRMKP